MFQWQYQTHSNIHWLAANSGMISYRSASSDEMGVVPLKMDTWLDAIFVSTVWRESTRFDTSSLDGFSGWKYKHFHSAFEPRPRAHVALLLTAKQWVD